MYLNTPPLATTIAQSGCQSEIRSASEPLGTPTQPLHPPPCLASNREIVCFIHCPSMRFGKFVSAVLFATVPCTVMSGQSGPRALLSRWDLCSTPSFLTMPCTSLYFPHDVLQHRAFLLDVVVRQCRPVFGPLPSHGRWCHWPSASNVVVLPVNVLMKICMTASEVTGCAACARDCDHAFGFLRFPRLPAFGTPSVF